MRVLEIPFVVFSSIQFVVRKFRTVGGMRFRREVAYLCSFIKLRMN